MLPMKHESIQRTKFIISNICCLILANLAKAK